MATEDPQYATIDEELNGGISIVIAIGIISLNVTEIAVLGKKGGKRNKPECMILSLSCADFLLGIAYLLYGTGLVILKHAPDSPQASAIASAAIVGLAFTIAVSILHIFAIAVERIYAIRRPLQYRSVVTKKRIIITILIIWTCSGAGIVVLNALGLHEDNRVALFGTITGWLIVVTIVVMILAYGYLAYFLFNRFQKTFPNSNGQDQAGTVSYNSQLRDTIFCIGVAVSFILCVLPAAICGLLSTRIVLVTVIGEHFIAVNSLINPILYFWRSHLSRQRTISSRTQTMKWHFREESKRTAASTQTKQLSIGSKVTCPKSSSTTNTPDVSFSIHAISTKPHISNMPPVGDTNL